MKSRKKLISKIFSTDQTINNADLDTSIHVANERLSGSYDRERNYPFSSGIIFKDGNKISYNYGFRFGTIGSNTDTSNMMILKDEYNYGTKNNKLYNNVRNLSLKYGSSNNTESVPITIKYEKIDRDYNSEMTNRSFYNTILPARNTGKNRWYFSRLESYYANHFVSKFCNGDTVRNIFPNTMVNNLNNEEFYKKLVLAETDEEKEEAKNLYAKITNNKREYELPDQLPAEVVNKYMVNAIYRRDDREELGVNEFQDNSNKIYKATMYSKNNINSKNILLSPQRDKFSPILGAQNINFYNNRKSGNPLVSIKYETILFYSPNTSYLERIDPTNKKFFLNTRNGATYGNVIVKDNVAKLNVLSPDNDIFDGRERVYNAYDNDMPIMRYDEMPNTGDLKLVVPENPDISGTGFAEVKRFTSFPTDRPEKFPNKVYGLYDNYNADNARLDDTSSRSVYKYYINNTRINQGEGSFQDFVIKFKKNMVININKPDDSKKSKLIIYSANKPSTQLIRTTYLDDNSALNSVVPIEDIKWYFTHKDLTSYTSDSNFNGEYRVLWNPSESGLDKSLPISLYSRRKAFSIGRDRGIIFRHKTNSENKYFLHRDVMFYDLPRIRAGLYVNYRTSASAMYSDEINIYDTDLGSINYMPYNTKFVNIRNTDYSYFIHMDSRVNNFKYTRNAAFWGHDRDVQETGVININTFTTGNKMWWEILHHNIDAEGDSTIGYCMQRGITPGAKVDQYNNLSTMLVTTTYNRSDWSDYYNGEKGTSPYPGTKMTLEQKNILRNIVDNHTFIPSNKKDSIYTSAVNYISGYVVYEDQYWNLVDMLQKEFTHNFIYKYSIIGRSSHKRPVDPNSNSPAEGGGAEDRVLLYNTDNHFVVQLNTVVGKSGSHNFRSHGNGFYDTYFSINYLVSKEGYRRITNITSSQLSTLEKEGTVRSIDLYSRTSESYGRDGDRTRYEYTKVATLYTVVRDIYLDMI